MSETRDIKSTAVCTKLGCSVGRQQTKLFTLGHNINVTRYILVHQGYSWEQLAVCQSVKVAAIYYSIQVDSVEL